MTNGITTTGGSVATIAEKYRLALTPGETTVITKDGPATREDLTVSVGAKDVLIPIAEAQSLLAAIAAKAERPKATDSEALALGQMLIGAYPNARPHDAKNYAAAVSSVFQMYPHDVGLEAARITMLEIAPSFAPTAGEVNIACERVLSRRTYAKRVLKAHLAEHERRKRQADELANRVSPERAKELIADLREKMGWTDKDAPTAPDPTQEELTTMQRALLAECDAAGLTAGEE